MKKRKSKRLHDLLVWCKYVLGFTAFVLLIVLFFTTLMRTTA